MAKTIILFSTKGGVGKTLIAANLAISIAREHKKRVCLVDLDVRGISDTA
ncbi:MAG: ParA family protein, partial [Candidatus Omnitrophica bacterium]|nr:ParA family protein [Candidatus Omnitrophota bacterium]